MTSHLSVEFTSIFGYSTFVSSSKYLFFKYKSTYSSKLLILIFFSFKYTFIRLGEVPATSYTLFFKSEIISLSNSLILNFLKSGSNVTLVKSSPSYFSISASLCLVILSLYSILNFFLTFLSAVSTINNLLNTFVNFAPKPFLPPVIFFSLSL